MKIKTQLQGIVAILLLSALINVAAVFLQLRKMSDDGRVVNYAGIVRGGTQRIIKLEIEGQKSDKLIANIEGMINGLIHGDKELQLPKAADKSFIYRMGNVEIAYKKLKEAIYRAREDNSRRDKLFKESEIFFNLTMEAVASAESFSKKNVNTLKTIQTALFVLNFVILASVWMISKQKIAKPLSYLTEKMKEIALGEGDLTKRLNFRQKDEMGELARWFDTFAEKIHEVAKGMDTAAAKISASVSNQITITTQQSASVSEITSTMEELSVASTQIADKSNSVAEVSNRALTNTEQGAGAVESVMTKMNEIDLDNQNNVKEIVELGKKSKEITKVMDIIDNIADQTKIIAFNAAIEAASGGESGKRFGVVAVEIRRLADNVMESTAEIKVKIDEIQEAINRLVITSEKGSAKIGEGLSLASDTVAILRNMLQDAQSTTDAARQISLSTNQQKTASSQILITLKEIEEGAKQAADSITQIGSIMGGLTRLSGNLKK